jgi:SAM-dependent methyltransferase
MKADRREDAGQGSPPGERDRVERIYSRYRRSARRRRAWAADNPGNEAIRAELLTAITDLGALTLADGAEVLDLGCGSGWWLAALAAAGIPPQKLFGVELLGDRVEAARRAVPGARIEHGDARSLRFEDGRFGLVLLFTVLSSLGSRESVRRVLREARRVLAPGGILLCYEPRYPNPLNRGTRRITNRDLAAAGVVPSEERTLTLLPMLARRLGTGTARLYPTLSRIRPLRTHRLLAYRGQQSDPPPASPG